MCTFPYGIGPIIQQVCPTNNSGVTVHPTSRRPSDETPLAAAAALAAALAAARHNFFFLL
jgi:protein-disulfide isomerase-like protein with CxxC motif